jgi:hypothetical protein
MDMTVKTINITLDEKEYAAALKKKGRRTWKQVLEDGLDKQE